MNKSFVFLFYLVRLLPAVLTACSCAKCIHEISNTAGNRSATSRSNRLASGEKSQDTRQCNCKLARDWSKFI